MRVGVRCRTFERDRGGWSPGTTDPEEGLSTTSSAASPLPDDVDRWRGRDVALWSEPSVD
jgi:hypothetical protein